jgi:hypothetical protein
MKMNLTDCFQRKSLKRIILMLLHVTFLEEAIKDYNQIYGTSWDTSAEGFQAYYKDLAGRSKDLVKLI